ncbi:MAG: HAD family hydrolase [Deltaproteobacteria bacterium]|nr:HAD family hydrolase [Deltaproteobacteria bacterium]MBW2448033.1 HAD family hydrolase [Deltaproteobacteria bacterium]
MTRCDTLIFDLDGTLWDATEASAVGWTRTARSLGVECEVTATDIGRVCGLTFEQCARTIFPELSEGRLQELMPLLGRGEEAAVRELGGRLYPGVVDGLRGLAARVPVDLLSNCHRWYLELFLEQAGLEDVFRDTLCHGDTGMDKAANLALLRERHGFRAAAYAGDTSGDAAACGEAGVEFVYAAYGFGEVDAPRHESFRELGEHLLGRVG